MSNSDYDYLLRRLKEIQDAVAKLSAIEVPPERVLCKLVYQSDHTVANNAWTAIAWDAETFDIGDCWDSSTPTRLIAPRDGYYAVHAEVTFLDTSDQSGIRQIGVRNSSDTIINSPLSRSAETIFGITACWAHLGAVWLAEGDWIEIVAYQNSGANKTLRGTTSGGASANHCAFWSIY